MFSSAPSAAMLSLFLTAIVYSQCVAAKNNTGTFQNPSSKERARFRYWLPDAGVDHDVVVANIQNAGTIGAGGVEFLPFYDYGNVFGLYPSYVNLTTTNFGTPAFHDIFLAALQAHKDAGLFMDVALGPNQGQGVPAENNDEGIQWDLVPVTTDLPSYGNFSGVVPGWGTGELIAVVLFEVLSTQNNSLPPGSPFLPAGPPYYLTLTIDQSSLQDVTSEVSSTGDLDIVFNTNGEHRIFAYYQQRTLHKNLRYEDSSDKFSIFANGSYTVDHFSARGAQTTINFWEKYILTDDIRQLLLDVGNYAWEDSLEIEANMSWTPSLPQRFQQKYGYSIAKYLPLLMFGNSNINIQATSPGDYQCILNTADGGLGYVNDYRGLIGDLYRDYLETLGNWTNTIGLKLSTQVSYNLPADMQSNIPFVDIPECESLQFKDNIDGYRQFTGAAQLADRNIISNEMGAVGGYDYHLPVPYLLWQIHRAIAGGVNQMVLHGLQYTGNYYGTTWPGYTSFGFTVSESWSNKQPVWDHGLAEALEHVARLQHVQRLGVAKTDVAIYNKVSATDPQFPDATNQSSLIHDGYSYSYLTPDNFKLPQATVTHGVLAEQGPAFKAMLVPDNSNFTLEAATALIRYAEAGLPIILGRNSGYYSSANVSGQTAVDQVLLQLRGTKNVHLSSGNTSADLVSLEITPNVQVRANGTWYTTWRVDHHTDTDYAYVFCDHTGSTGVVEIATDKAPFLLNTWTGEKLPIIAYTTSNGRTTIPLSLAGNETVVIAFINRTDPNSPMGAAPESHLVSLPSNLLGYNYTQDKKWKLQLARSESVTVVDLSNNTKLSLGKTIQVPKPFSLEEWTLVAEHWEAPPNISDVTVIADKRNTTHQLSSLVSWLSLPELANTSGVGYYSSAFRLANTNISGAYLSLPPILHAIKIQVNGKSVGPVSYLSPQIDIGPYVHLDGTLNEILAIVPSTMWNYLKSIFDQVTNLGQGPLITKFLPELPGSVDNGLVGEVRVIPYISVEI